jgi:carboxylate-amine ligase
MLQIGMAAGLLPDEASLYWSLRPHHAYPTLEFRVCDACPSLDHAVAIVSLARALVATAVEGRLEHPAHFSGGMMDALLRGNEWQACRYGLRAQIARPSDGAPELLVDSVRRLLDRLARAGEALGDAEWLQRVELILAQGNGADRIREMVRCRTEGSLVGWLTTETLLGVGMDRRREQRPEPLGAAAD